MSGDAPSSESCTMVGYATVTVAFVPWSLGVMLVSIDPANLVSNVLAERPSRGAARMVTLVAGLALGACLAFGGTGAMGTWLGFSCATALAQEDGEAGPETMSEVFETRTSAPERWNAWFYSDTNPYYAHSGLAPKGYPEGGSYVTGNCTWYAWGRIAEIMGRDPGIGPWGPEGMLSDAVALGYETGFEPREGALVEGIAGYGNPHVAVVEKIVDGVPYVSQSAYRRSDSWPGFENVVFDYLPLGSVYGNNSVTYVYFGDYASAHSRTIDINDLDIRDGVMYRLYNPYTGEHFYTASPEETVVLAGIGWSYEGVGWTAPEAGIPVFRLYNPYAPGGDHHYTASAEECESLESVGWIYENVGWYSDYGERVALYRQYNPNAESGAHNYTASKEENDALVSLGWHEEGIGWYGIA